MSDATYRVFCAARKGSPLAEGEFEAVYSRVEAAWIEEVEAAVRASIARERRAIDRFPEVVEEYGAELASIPLESVAVIGRALVSASRFARGEQP